MAQECETLDTRRFQGWTRTRLVTMKSLLSGIFFWSASKKHHKALGAEAKSTTTIQRAPTEAMLSGFWMVFLGRCSTSWSMMIHGFSDPANDFDDFDITWWFIPDFLALCLPDRSGSSGRSNYQRHVGMMWPLPRSILMQSGTRSGRSGRSIPIGAAFDDRNEQLSVNHILFVCWRGGISLLIEFKI